MAIARPHPNWGQAETISNNTLPLDTAATVASHFDHAQDYIGQDELVAAVYHIRLAVGKMAA